MKTHCYFPRVFIFAAVMLLKCSQGVILSNATNRNFIYNTYKYNVIYNLTVNSSTEQILDFIEDSPDLRGFPTRIHVSTNKSIDGDYPIFITATQQKEVSSWRLPLIVQTQGNTLIYPDMARTLCPYDADSNVTSSPPLVQIITSNPENVSLDIKLRRVQDFYVQVDKVKHFFMEYRKADEHVGYLMEIELTASPGTPKYYYFSFEHNPWNVTNGFLPRFNYTIPKSVILIIESEDQVCASISIQNASCPVFDNEKDMLFQGYHLSMMGKGGITLTQSMFPKGFYIVFIVKESDGSCMGESETELTSKENDRVKTFRFRVIATISYTEYLYGASIILCAVIGIAIMTPTVMWIAGKQYRIILEDESSVAPSTSGVDEEVAPIINAEEHSESEESNCGNDTEFPEITLAHLSRVRPSTHAKRSHRYFWNVLTVSIVYALPVVQLLATYQKIAFQTGDQDVCYYNFLCAHPLGSLADFNHVFTNIGYVVFGITFILMVRARQIKARRVPPNVGLRPHFGLLYAMGLALIMEGVLSACYHLCPNKMNFQFDSTFMYLLGLLTILYLYNIRRPDRAPHAHSACLVLAFMMALGLYGIMYPSILFWVLFTILHLAACFIFTIDIYFVGRIKLDRSLPRRVLSSLRTLRHRAFLPNYKTRAILLAVANIINWLLAGYGLYEHNKDFARHLLAIVMGNAILYFFSYLLLKLLHEEKILLHTWLCVVMATVAWIFAVRFFLDSRTKWSLPPALSREHNAACSWLHLADSHDAWHVTSALALLLSLVALLCADDALHLTSHQFVPVL